VFQDTGVGIPPEHLEKIFSGIGLSLVYRTIQLHDGEIEVQSTPGRGTTFRILLREAPTPVRRPRQSTEILGLRNAGSFESDETISAS
jgi:signal transduction histidine kinase